MRQTSLRTGLGIGGGLVASAALCALLAACGSPGGSANAAGASATATCPPRTAFKTVTGTISATGTGTITVTASNGTQTLVHLSSTTRVTQLVAGSVSDLTSGTTVQVTTDANATSAQRIALVTAPAGGFGGAGGFRGTPGARRTPPAGVNAACFQRQGQGQGQGSGRGFPGVRGTVTTATSTQLVVDDTQGQTLTLTITPSTVIEKNAPGTAANLTAGATVIVTGSATSDGIEARAITVQTTAAK